MTRTERPLSDSTARDRQGKSRSQPLLHNISFSQLAWKKLFDYLTFVTSMRGNNGAQGFMR